MAFKVCRKNSRSLFTINFLSKISGPILHICFYIYCTFRIPYFKNIKSNHYEITHLSVCLSQPILLNGTWKSHSCHSYKKAVEPHISRSLAIRKYFLENFKGAY